MQEVLTSNTLINEKDVDYSKKFGLAPDNHYNAGNAYSLALASCLAYRKHDDTKKPDVDFINTIANNDWNYPHSKVCISKSSSGFENNFNLAIVMGNTKEIVISFRGTDMDDNLVDFFQDLNFAPTPCISMKNETFGKATTGFYTAYSNVKEQVIEEIQRIKNVTGNKTPDIWITGHSLGGAMALISTIDLAAEGEFQGIYTYGQPRAGDLDFVNTIKPIIKNKYYRVVNAYTNGSVYGHDIVTVIPPPLLRDQMKTYYKLLEDSKHWNGIGPFFKAILNPLESMLPDTVPFAHAGESYTQLLNSSGRIKDFDNFSLSMQPNIDDPLNMWEMIGHISMASYHPIVLYITNLLKLMENQTPYTFKALSFNTPKARVKADNIKSYDFGYGDFRIETKIRSTGTGTLVSSKSTEGGNPWNSGWLLVLQPDGRLKFVIDSGTQFYSVVTNPTNVVDGNWHTISAYRVGAGISSGELYIEIDGEPVETNWEGAPSAVMHISNNEPVIIGGTNQQQEEYNQFRGDMMYVAIYNSAIKCGGNLVGYWNFDQTEGNTKGYVDDLSEARNNGILENFGPDCFKTVDV